MNDNRDYDEHWYGVSCSECKHDYLYGTRFEQVVGKWAHAIRHPTHLFALGYHEQWNDTEDCSPDYSHVLKDTE